MFSFIVSNDKIHHLNVGNGLDRSVDFTSGSIVINGTLKSVPYETVRYNRKTLNTMSS